MADRDLKVPDFISLFQAHGCSAELAKNGFVKVWRRQGDLLLFFTQHAHKGAKDTFHRNVVRRARRQLGFADLSDADFYRPLD
jgi:hypothetical protein